MAVLVGRVNKPRMAKVGEGSKTARRRLEREQLRSVTIYIDIFLFQVLGTH